ncbi:unnamed protein product [Caenorhabditis nigoni]
MLTSDGPQFVIYVLLRIFHIFVQIIADKNRGNTDLVCSILRDISHNSWIEFYKKHVHYIKLYTEELSKTNEFKIIEEHIIKERKCIITIEYSYPDDPEITGSKEVKLLNTNRNGTTTLGRFKNAFSPFYYIFGDHRYVSPEKNIRAVKKAPEVPKIEKVAPVTDAKTRSDSNNGTKHDATRLSDIGSGGKDPKTDKEETIKNQNEHINQEIYEPTTSTKSDAIFDNFLKDMETLKSPQLDLTSDSRQDDTVKILNEEFQQVADEVSGIQEPARKILTVLETKKDELEEGSSSLYTPLGEDVDTENEGFIEKLDEKEKANQRKFNEELQEIRRLQKQKFAVLLLCIQLRSRFEEKEAEWSDWIEHCYRRLIVTVITQFADFQEELGVSEKSFRKVLEESPETVQSEVRSLCGRMEAMLHKLSIIFENLAKIDENFQDALFIRILQKSSCDISIKLISVLNCLDAIEYSTEWYQELTSKFDHIQTSDVPGVTELKKLCKEDNWDGLRNMEFPSWELRNHVKIEEYSSDEDEDVMEDKPENLVEVEKATSDSSQDETMNFLTEEIPQMTHGISGIQEQTRKTVADLRTNRNESEEGSSVLYAPLEEDQDPAQDSMTETADNYDFKDSSDEDEDFQKQLEEQKRAHQLELKEKQQQRMDRRVKFQKETEEENRLFQEKLRRTGSNSQ